MCALKFADEMTTIMTKNSLIEAKIYKKCNIKKGLRNENGTGVTVGLTKVSNVVGYILENDVKKPIDGKLYYRGIKVKDLVDGYSREKRRGFEEIMYLLLFGELPTKNKLKEFNSLLDKYRELPNNFTENMILKIPSKDIMNKLQRSILVLYSHDDNPDDISAKNMLIQSIKLIARFPTIISYGYQAKAHNFDKKSLYIHNPKKNIGTAGNILYMIRPDNSYTETEASVLDLCLVLHADHGGGNNSAFATHVVSSSGTDTYSAIASAVGCLKGPKHGGANIKVKEMVMDIKESCNYKNKEQLKKYLEDILDKKRFDKKGLIYGMGHAVYTYSDSRAILLKEKAISLAIEKDCLDEFDLYKNIEELTKEIFLQRRGEKGIISANVDLYSGFVYEMLNIPEELYTSIFAVARVAGWCAHRIEQVLSDQKIIRPAYKNLNQYKEYVSINERK